MSVIVSHFVSLELESESHVYLLFAISEGASTKPTVWIVTASVFSTFDILKPLDEYGNAHQR